MAVVFCGSKQHDFGTALYTTTTTTFFDSAYQTDGLGGNMEAANGMFVLLPAAVSGDFWLHYRLFHNRNISSGMANADGMQCSFYDSQRRLLAYVDMLDGITTAFANGDSLVTGTGSYTWPSTGNPTLTFDVRVAVSASSIQIDYYVGGTLVSTATASNTTGGKGKPQYIAIDNDDIQGTSGGDNGVSEVIMTDGESTIGWRLATLNPNGAGNYNAWGGDWNSIVNGGDGRFLVAAETGLRESWALSDYNGPATPASIRGVFVKLQGDKGDTGPQTYQAFLRLSGSDYDAAAQTPVAGSFNMFEWANNPATSAAWDTSVFNAMEAGVRSQT